MHKLLITVGAVAVAAGTAFALAVPAGAAATDPPAPPNTPTAHSFAGRPTVGPIFRHGLGSAHSCTGSVLASRSGDLVLTAAHCVTGTAAGWQFAPGYHDGSTPYGVWTVAAAYLPPRWLTAQDPRDDYAILRVDPVRRHGRERTLQRTTGANLLATAPRRGTRITDVAYNHGIDDAPITCTVPTYRTDGYPAFNCHGYVDGSSGSPWLARGRHGTTLVRGVIGGLHQGGCYEYTSYSAPFGRGVRRLLARADRAALHDRPGDTAPAPGSDCC